MPTPDNPGRAKRVVKVSRRRILDGGPDAVAELRRRVLDGAPDPAVDPSDFNRLTARALEAMQTGAITPRGTEVRVRIGGAGIRGHDVPVRLAAQILDAVQGAVTAVGAALSRAQSGEGSKEPRRTGAVGIRKATEFTLSPTIGAGSVVFYLEGPVEVVNGDELPGSTGTQSLLESAITTVFNVIGVAQTDGAEDIGQLTEQLQRFGVQAASRLSAIADQSLTNSIELELGMWSATTGRRASVELKQRGASAIREAVDRARDRTERVTLEGRLRTVSDGADKVRLTLDDDRELRMAVDPDVGVALGGLLGKRVSADVEIAITWHIATGKETRTYKLSDAALVPGFV